MQSEMRAMIRAILMVALVPQVIDRVDSFIEKQKNAT